MHIIFTYPQHSGKVIAKLSSNETRALQQYCHDALDADPTNLEALANAYS